MGRPLVTHPNPNPEKLCTSLHQMAVLSGTFPAPAEKGLVSLASQWQGGDDDDPQKLVFSREMAEPAPRSTKLAAACFLLIGDLVNLHVDPSLDNITVGWWRYCSLLLRHGEVGNSDVCCRFTQYWYPFVASQVSYCQDSIRLVCIA